MRHKRGLLGLVVVLAGLAIGLPTAQAGWRGLSDFFYFDYSPEPGHACRDGLDFGAAYPFGSLPNLKVEALVGATQVLPPTPIGPLDYHDDPLPGVGVDPLNFYSFRTVLWSTPVTPGTDVLLQFSDGTNTSTSEVIEDCWLDPWPFDGVLWPLRNPPHHNLWKAGWPVPVRFGLGGDRGLDVFEPGYPRFVEAGTGTEHAVATKLFYVAATGRYLLVWKSDSALAGKSGELVLRFTHTPEQHVLFRFF